MIENKKTTKKYLKRDILILSLKKIRTDVNIPKKITNLEIFSSGMNKWNIKDIKYKKNIPSIKSKFLIRIFLLLNNNLLKIYEYPKIEIKIKKLIVVKINIWIIKFIYIVDL